MKTPPLHIAVQQLKNHPARPENPCTGCGLWNANCNQAACPIFQNYQAGVLKLWTDVHGRD
ncbi:MAG: hypothetical protein LBR41_01280 [Rickettsiales bacterium]|nr:hypothetical protein [Rickettsiales bacterium]